MWLYAAAADWQSNIKNELRIWRIVTEGSDDQNLYQSK